MTAAVQLPDKRDWTVDDVASLPEDLHYELINGRLVLTPAPMPLHRFICRQTANALEVHGPENILVTEDQSVVIDSRNEPRPDVVVMREEGADRTPVFAADVLLVVEVVSPSSTTSDRQEKAKLYAYAGFAAYWIIDPLAERITFTQFLLGPGGAYRQQVQTDGLVKIDQPWPVTLDLPAWTRRRDRLRDAGRSDEARDN
ncbi:MAG: Uma2 family endonuclease [Propionibacteriaceae bacterium]